MLVVANTSLNTACARSPSCVILHDFPEGCEIQLVCAFWPIVFLPTEAAGARLFPMHPLVPSQRRFGNLFLQVASPSVSLLEVWLARTQPSLQGGQCISCTRVSNQWRPRQGRQCVECLQHLMLQSVCLSHSERGREMLAAVPKSGTRPEWQLPACPPNAS